jgi:RNA polymerase sigma-70 factor, ECF subfamily
VDDRGLIERAQRGDADAYDELVRRYQEIAFRTAYLITRAAPEAEEAAQDAFVKAYFALSRFRLDAPFRPWLLRIVANEARNRRVAAGRRAGLALRAAEASRAVSSIAQPETSALAAEERAELLAAVNTLGESDRAVIAYRYFLDLREEEMAAVIGCARGTVKSRLSRALGRLRARLPRPSVEEAGSRG